MDRSDRDGRQPPRQTHRQQEARGGAQRSHDWRSVGRIVSPCSVSRKSPRVDPRRQSPYEPVGGTCAASNRAPPAVEEANPNPGAATQPLQVLSELGTGPRSWHTIPPVFGTVAVSDHHLLDRITVVGGAVPETASDNWVRKVRFEDRGVPAAGLRPSPGGAQPPRDTRRPLASRRNRPASRASRYTASRSSTLRVMLTMSAPSPAGLAVLEVLRKAGVKRRAPRTLLPPQRPAGQQTGAKMPVRLRENARPPILAPGRVARRVRDPGLLE